MPPEPLTLWGAGSFLNFQTTESPFLIETLAGVNLNFATVTVFFAAPWATTGGTAAIAATPATAASLRERFIDRRPSREWSIGVKASLMTLAGSRCLRAHRPGLGALLGQQHRGALVLLGLGGRGGIAGAAHGPPGRAAELVLAAVAAGRRDRRGVAAGLALGDGRQVRVVGVGRRRRSEVVLRRGGARADAQGGERLRAGDAVDGQALALLEAPHRGARLRAV